jgi:hypothetical protein
MRYGIAIVVGFAICVSLLFAFSHLYDSPVIQDGPAYPRQISQFPLYSIHTYKPCAEATEEALSAINRLRSCTEASQCGGIVNHFHLPLMAINKSKISQYVALEDRLDRSCRPKHNMDWFPHYGFEYTCINDVCDVQAKPRPPEVTKQQLIEESLQMIERANDN